MRASRLTNYAVSLVAACAVGCGTAPRSGSTIDARVSVIVSPRLFSSVKDAGHADAEIDSPLEQVIADAISQGVSMADVIDHRLILCNCRHNNTTQGGSWFKVLLPKGVHLSVGDYVELEAGVESWVGHPGTMSRLLRVLPSKGPARPLCNPRDGSN
jgi:hypothetical protein